MTPYVNITAWTLLESYYLCTLQAKMGKSTQSTKVRLATDCDLVHDLAKFQLMKANTVKLTIQYIISAIFDTRM